MRIALVNSIRFYGGGEKRVMRAVRDFRERGHEVSVLGVPGGELSERTRAEGVPFFPVTFRHYCSPVSLLSLSRALSAAVPDVVVAYDERAIRVTAVAAGIGGSRRLPVVYYQGLQGSFKNKPYNRLVVGPRITRVIANAEAIREELLAFGWLDPARISVVYDGVDPTPVEQADPTGIREELGDGPEALVVVVVARLVEEKGHAFLLPVIAELAPAHPRLRVWIAGEGPEAEALQAQARELGVTEQVRFLGFRADVPRLLRTADVLCHPSRREGAPNAVREAMTAGLPVVAVAASGTPELMVQGETGLLSPIGDAAGLRRNLDTVLRDPELRRRMGEAGRKRALTEFSEERCAERWLALLGDCVRS